MMRRIASALVSVALMAMVAACAPTAPTETSPGRTEATASRQGSELRTDLDPLTKRFTAIGAPVSASWYSGTMGDDRAPGPTTYWIDAVIVLTPETTAELEDLQGSTSTSQPAVVAELQDAIPQGAVTSSPELNAALSEDGWYVTAWLIPSANTLVISALGE